MGFDHEQTIRWVHWELQPCIVGLFLVNRPFQWFLKVRDSACKIATQDGGLIFKKEAGRCFPIIRLSHHSASPGNLQRGSLKDYWSSDPLAGSRVMIHPVYMCLWRRSIDMSYLALILPDWHLCLCSLWSQTVFHRGAGMTSPHLQLIDVVLLASSVLDLQQSVGHSKFDALVFCQKIEF